MKGKRQRRWMVPEVLQASSADGGPAALKSLLEGFGVAVSYDRLREACQAADGTSFDTLEVVAERLGLDVDRALVPTEDVFFPEASVLPAIVVARLPSGAAHFIVLWRRHGPLVQIMDPAVGRRWVSVKKLAARLHVQSVYREARRWRAGLDGQDRFCDVLEKRLAKLGFVDPSARIDDALADPGFRSITTLDASARLGEALVQAGTLSPGAAARRAVEDFFASTLEATGDEAAIVPERFWSAVHTGRGAHLVEMRGVPTIRVLGVRPGALGLR